MKIIFKIETEKDGQVKEKVIENSQFSGAEIEINVLVRADKSISILTGMDDILFAGQNWYVGIRDYDRLGQYDEEGDYNPFVVKTLDEITLGAEKLNQKSTTEITNLFNRIRNEHYDFWNVADVLNEEYEILCQFDLEK